MSADRNPSELLLPIANNNAWKAWRNQSTIGVGMGIAIGIASAVGLVEFFAHIKTSDYNCDPDPATHADCYSTKARSNGRTLQCRTAKGRGFSLPQILPDG